ncbi:MAG: hypothetical protein ACE5G2_02940 [Candidatus Krumholzibacteriia bacterium]
MPRQFRVFITVAVAVVAIAAISCTVDDSANQTSPVAADGGVEGLALRDGHAKLDAAGHAAKLQERLELTDEQTVHVELVFQETSSTERVERLRGILTDAQFAQYEELAQRCRKRSLGQHAKHGQLDPTEHAAKLQEYLSLSNEQADQVKEVFAAFQPRSRELHAQFVDIHQAVKNNTASPDEFASLKAERASMRDEIAARLATILTDAQFREYEQLRARCEAGGRGCPQKGRQES